MLQQGSSSALREELWRRDIFFAFLHGSIKRDFPTLFEFFPPPASYPHPVFKRFVTTHPVFKRFVTPAFPPLSEHRPRRAAQAVSLEHSERGLLNQCNDATTLRQWMAAVATAAATATAVDQTYQPFPLLQFPHQIERQQLLRWRRRWRRL